MSDINPVLTPLSGAVPSSDQPDSVDDTGRPAAVDPHTSQPQSVIQAQPSTTDDDADDDGSECVSCDDTPEGE